jgi:hypothetical protein
LRRVLGKKLSFTNFCLAHDKRKKAKRKCYYLSKLALDTLSTANGCPQHTFFQVIIDQENISASFKDESESCPNKNDGLIMIQEIKGYNNYTLLMRDSIIKNPQLPFTFANLPPNSYTISISSDLSCIYSDTIIILASTSEGFTIKNDQFELQKGQTIVLNPIIDP